MKLLKEAIEQFLFVCQKLKNLSHLTLKAYRLDLQQFKVIVGEIEISKVTKNEISKFHYSLQEQEMSPRTIKRKLACIRTMFKWLEQEDIIDSSPFNKIRNNIKLPKHLPRNVTSSDIKKMILKSRSELAVSIKQDTSFNIVGKRELNPITSLVSLELLVSTGLRISELANIQLTDIDLAEQKIKIFGKGSRERYVFIADKTHLELIKGYISSRLVTTPNNNNFLVNSRGQPASAQFLRKLIKELAIRANTSKHITPHMFRHSAACELLESGVDIRFVQRLLGHSSISTTEIYTHVSDKVLKEKIIQANVRNQILNKGD